MYSTKSTKETIDIKGFKDINLKELIVKYLKKWYWFLISIIICISIAFTLLRYSIPLYDVNSTIVISQEDKLTSSGLSGFKDLGLEQTQDKIENEIQILKSKTLIKNIVEKLNLNILYFYEGTILDIEEYRNPIVRLNFIDSDSFSKQTGLFNVKINSNETFSFVDEDENILENHNFNTPINTELGTIKITVNTKEISKNIDKVIKIKVLPVTSTVDSYRARINIITVGQNSSVLQISLRDAIIKRAEDFIDNLIVEYSKRKIKNKNETSKKTSNFINDRLLEISNNLSNVDSQASKYMSKFGIRNDVDSESSKLDEISLENNKEITKNETQNLLIQSTIEFIDNQDFKQNVIPSNLNIDNSFITNDIGKYNKLILKRKRLLKTSLEENPVIVKIDDELEGLKEILKQNLTRIKSQLNIKLKLLKNKRKEIRDKLTKSPEIQKNLRKIARDQGVTEKLYLFLLQKKEETDITSHITLPNFRVIDSASPVSFIPVSPNKKSTYLLAIVLGFLIPFLFIYITDLLDTRVQSKKDIEKLMTVPIIGHIPKNNSKENLVINKTNKTPISEAFRILRSNLDFLLKGIDKNKGKLIFVTSCISGEGKTFISSNIAKSIALLGKKVAYIGTDLRLPKFHEIFDLSEGSSTKGFSNFIINTELKPEDIIYKKDELYIIPPGVVPPNPTLLLNDERVETIFKYLEQNFDYIIVDTAPISLVTDTLLISEFADVTVHIVKENYTDKRLLTIPEEYKKENRLRNLSVLLNFSSSNMSGAYGYGYGYNKQDLRKTKLNIFKK